MPAAAAFEYPWSTRYWPIASRLLPLAMSDCTVELVLDEDVVLVLPLEEVAVEVDDRSDPDDVDLDDVDLDDVDLDDGHVDDPEEAESAVDGAHVDGAEVDDPRVDDADVDGAGALAAGALAAWWRPLGIVTTWPA